MGESASCMARAVWSPMLGITWEYVSSVIAMVACPSSSWTNLGCVPWVRSSVAQVCLRSWNRMWGSRAFLNKGARLRLRRLDGLTGPPVSVVKSSPGAVGAGGT